MMRYCVLLLSFAWISCSIGLAQTSPIESAGFTKATSHDQLLGFIRELAAHSSRFVIEDIGSTVQGRNIPSIRVRPADTGANVRVLLLCQQHGNEPSGKEAALMLLGKIVRGEIDSLLTHLDITIVPSVNPDGNEAGKRSNGNGEDLNRNHLLLTQPEVVAIHALYDRFQPEVTLDVHEYSAYRKEFRDAGYVRSVDEQFGAPTNLNISPAIRKYALGTLFPFLEERLNVKGVSFSNYLKMNEPADTVRPSTTSIDDGRQSFGILNRLSLILEGKNGRGMNDELRRRTLGQLAAIEAFLEFVNAHAPEIKSMIETETAAIAHSQEPVVVQMDYLFTGQKAQLPVFNLRTGKDSTAAFAIAPDVTPLETVSRPKGYVIPKGQQALIDWLKRHHVRIQTVSEAKKQLVEQYAISDIQARWMENKSTWFVAAEARKKEIMLEAGDIIVPLDQPHATMLVIALEPSSMWGLVQSDEFAVLRTKGSEYPISRIISGESSIR